MVEYMNEKPIKRENSAIWKIEGSFHMVTMSLFYIPLIPLINML
jgi:hypothetical protein